MTIPSILSRAVFVLKNNAPSTMVQIGVRAFKVPTRELSILCCAIQKRSEGARLPKKPERNININFCCGIVLKHLIAIGSRIMPEEIILNEATCKAERPTSPSLINIKLLPQTMDKSIKINQLKFLLSAN